MTKPLKCEAVIGEAITAGIFYAIATATLHLGIHIATSDEAQQAVADFFYQCTDKVKEKFQRAAALANFGYYCYYQWSKEAWSECAHAIAEWFTIDRYGDTNGITFGKVEVSDGNIDLSKEASIHITIPLIGDGYQAIRYNLNDCDLMVYANCPSWLYSELQGWYSDDHSSTSPRGTVVRIEPYNSDLCFCYYGNAYSSFQSGGVYYNNAFSDYVGAWSEYFFDLSFVNIYNTDDVAVVLNQYDCHFVSRDEKYIYDIRNQGDLGWAFVGYYGGIYKNMYFDTAFDALNWFMNQCGLSLTSSVPYVPSADVPDIQIDTDTVSKRLDEIQDMPDDETLPIVLPGTEAQYQELLDNPSRVTDITATTVYGGDINIPVITNADLWKTKFPLCIPFDIINLFTGFFAEAEAPNFHILVLPADSFGLTNDDIYFDLDFADYNYLVQILRFFIAVSFVIWLIIITRKVIS